MQSHLWLALFLALPAVALAPSGASDGAGLSGQCYDDDSATNPSGGEDEIRFDTETGPEVGLQPMPGDHGITDALAKFVTGTVEDGGQTGTACDRYDCFNTPAVCAQSGQKTRYDYLEVDARVGSTFVQVCYRGSASIAGDCPQHPTGPG